MSNARGHGWCLYQDTWQDLKKMLDTIKPTWCRTVLVDSHKNHVPTCPGVYAIEFPAPIQLGATHPHTGAIRAPIYIGRSFTSIRERFTHHTSDEAQNRILLARKWSSMGEPRVFIWAELRDPNLIQALESRLIECFTPPCNKLGGVLLSVGRPAGAQT